MSVLFSEATNLDVNDLPMDNLYQSLTSLEQTDDILQNNLESVENIVRANDTTIADFIRRNIVTIFLNPLLERNFSTLRE